MLKLFGAVLILLAGTLAGFHQAARFAARPKQIRELILAMQRLETEISYGFTPLPDAFRRLAGQLGEPLRSIFKSAANHMASGSGNTAQESIQRSLHDHWKRTAMKAPERDILHQLSFTLGTSDRQDQIKHIALAAQQLKHEEALARDEQAKYEKISRSLGLLVGALIVILIF
ncbi:stage III sporulation protein SpoIIIAB [Paenibacillus sp. FSL M7-1455]|uniref:Stage III sporulation protein SpoAB n=1 Tax=Paenibacillus cookii TaxID=157839 RepID=A0ABQ4LQ05_9BACL|nr:stage III sporulation protein SpoIIIAB [Paenibacillus cookii]KHF32487.1 stage III sporulation protein SpoAB [Paenibacillus sp. P1XP2]GIO65352.1 stage III sporulation protein SpoAB [Paenibacillus cookii]HWO54793.1 stage III sporulation protein SpoIIIAB [Paenibacillus cookii]